MKKLFSIILFFIGILNINAQDVVFTASAPRAVTINETFRLTYSINANPKSFVAPEFVNFDILAGPSTSQSTNMQWINGQMSKSTNYSFTYVMVPKAVGKFTIEPAEVEVQKEKHKSNPLVIEVVKDRSNDPTNTTTENTQGADIPKDNLFLKILPSTKSVFEGEHLVVTIKLYTRVGISGFKDSEMPSFKGFFKQVIEEPQQIQFTRENVDGVLYETGVLQKVVLYPQQNGKIEIDPARLDLFIRQKSGTTSVFDDFFGSSYQNIEKRIIAPGLTVNVKPLPSENKPESFNNAVGIYSMTANLDKTDIKANEAITYKVKISGTGNLKLIEAPTIEFSPDFEIYDPKITENIKNAETGSTGSKTFEYLIIPRHEGNYKIPKVEFSYFDPSLKTYKTLKSKEYEINVAKDDNVIVTNVGASGISKEDVKYIGKDIRFIKTGEIDFSVIDNVIIRTYKFWLAFVTFLIVFSLLLLILNKQYKSKKDIVLVRNKKANKIAKKRLKAAELYLNSNKSEKFYEEILKALWGYLSDKLNIPLAELSMDNAISILESYSLDISIIKQFSSIITTCEYARYAPIEGESQLDIDYDKAVEVLSKFEQKIK